MKENNQHFLRLEQMFGAGPIPASREYLEKVATRFISEMDVWASGGSAMAEIKDRRRAQEPRLLTLDPATAAIFSRDFSRDNIGTEAGQIAHFRLSGVMMQDDFLSTAGVQTLAAQMREASASANVDGILLEVDTGGGELLAGQTLKNAIKDASVPVVVFAHYMASAGVWGTVHADHIMAAGAGSEIGSIGVYAEFSRGFIAWYKEAVISTYSRASGEKNKVFRAALDGNMKPLEDSLTMADEIFMDEVSANRPLKGDTQSTLSGATFYAEDALARGLVDSIGTFAEAVGKVAELISAKKSDMNGFSFRALAAKFLGLTFNTEEEATAALETSPAPLLAEEALSTIKADMQALRDDVDALLAAMTSANVVIAELQAVEVDTEGPMASLKADLAADLAALKAGFAADLAAIKGTASGAEVQGDGGLQIPGTGAGAPQTIDLLAGLKAQKITLVRGL